MRDDYQEWIEREAREERRERRNEREERRLDRVAREDRYGPSRAGGATLLSAVKARTSQAGTEEAGRRPPANTGIVPAGVYNNNTNTQQGTRDESRQRTTRR